MERVRDAGKVRRIRRWRRRVAAAAALLLLPTAFAAWLSLPGKTWIARVSKLTGSSQIFMSRGKMEYALETSALLSAGDTLETRSCDAWIELELRETGVAEDRLQHELFEFR